MPFAVDPTAAALIGVDVETDFVRAGAHQEVPSARATPEGLHEGHAILDELAPHPSDVVTDRLGCGCSHSTALEDLLGAAPAWQVWLAGSVTQVCVEESAREGYRRSSEMIVAVNAVSAFNDDLHRATLRNLAAKFTLVADTSAGLSTVDAEHKTGPRAPPGSFAARSGHTAPSDPDAEELSNG